MSAVDAPTHHSPSAQEKVEAAGLDLVNYLRTDLPAAGLADFVHIYFPALHANKVVDDLRVVNSPGDEVFVRRLCVNGHAGVRYIKGTQQFATAAIRSVLDNDRAKNRDAKSLIDMLALFNNR